VRIVNDLRERGVNLVCLRGSIDTSTDVGQMFLGLFGSLAQHERALIKERTAKRLGAKKAGANGLAGKASQAVSARTLTAERRRSRVQAASDAAKRRLSLSRLVGSRESASEQSPAPLGITS
jgi:DNA invertase Pin-like site-specific DNA recombinase